MYMKNTVSKEMKLKQQPTHIHMPHQKRKTGTPHQHQASTDGAQADEQQQRYTSNSGSFCTPGEQVKVAQTAQRSSARGQSRGHKERAAQAYQVTPLGEAVVERQQQQQLRSNHVSHRGYSASIGSNHQQTAGEANMAKQGLLSSQSMHSLLLQKMGAEYVSRRESIGSVGATQSNLLHGHSSNSVKRAQYKAKQYMTAHSKSDRKNQQSFTDEHSSPELRQKSGQKQPGSNNLSSSDVFNASLALFPSEKSKQVTAQAQQQNLTGVTSFNQENSPSVMKLKLSDSKQKTPVVRAPKLAQRRATPESDGKVGESLYDHRDRISLVKSSQGHVQHQSTSITQTAISPNSSAVRQQEVKMEDLMETPKRINEPAFTQAQLYSSQQRQQTHARFQKNAASHASSMDRDQHAAARKANYQSRLQTEEGDGAQAIENESDRTDEEGFSGTPRDAQAMMDDANEMMDSPAIAQKRLISLLGPQVAPPMQQQPQMTGIGAQLQTNAYQHENSSFGLQNASAVVDQNYEENHQASLGEDDEEESEVVVKASQNAIVSDASISIHDARRSRSLRGNTLKNLFCKSQGTANESSSILAEEQHMKVAANQGISAPRMHQIQPQAAVSNNAQNHDAASLPQSRSQLNFQYLLGDEEHQQQSVHIDQNCLTDEEEIFDQDGGQDGGSNFVDVDSCEDNSVLSPKASNNVQQAIINFRRHNLAKNSVGPQIGAWAHNQEPHIDEELSDAEEDNTSENFPDSGTVLVEEQTEELVELDSMLTQESIQTKKRRGGRVIATEEGDTPHETAKKNSNSRADLQTPKRLIHQKSVKTIMQPNSLTTSLSTHANDYKRSNKANTRSSVAFGESVRSRFGKADQLYSKVAVSNRPSKQGFQTPLDLAAAAECSDKGPYALPPKSAHSTTKRKQPLMNRSKMKINSNPTWSKPAKLSSIDFSQPTLSPKRADNSELSTTQAYEMTNSKKVAEPLSRGTPRQQPITNFQLQQEQAKLIRYKQINQTKMNNTAFGSSSIHGKSQQSAANNSSYNNFLNDKNCSSKAGKEKEKDKEIQGMSKEAATKLLSQNLVSGFSSNNMIQKFESQQKSRQIKGAQANAQMNSKLITVVGSSSSKKQNSGSNNKNATNSESNTSIFVPQTAQSLKDSAASGTRSSVLHCKQFQQAASSSSIKPFNMGETFTTGTELPGETSKISSGGGSSPEKRFMTQKSRQGAQMTAYSASTPFSVNPTLPSSGSQVQKSKTQKDKAKGANSGHNSMLTGASSSSTILQNHLKQLQHQQQSMSALHLVTQQSVTSELTQHTHKTSTQSKTTYHNQAPSTGKISVPQSVPASSITTKTMNSVKESNASASGFASHTAARGANKRGFLRDSYNSKLVGSGTIEQSQTASMAQSTAQLPMAGDESSLMLMQPVMKTSAATGGIKDSRTISKGKKKVSSFKAHTSSSVSSSQAFAAGQSMRTVKRGSISTAGAYSTIEASKPAIRPHESMGSLGPMRQPSSSKNVDGMQVKFDEPMAANHTSQHIFQSTTRQRTNTTLGLQSNKHSSMRQSMNNLTLNDLISSQPGSHNAASLPQKSAGAKHSSTRGGQSVKLGSQLSVSFIAPSSTGFKSSSLVKNQSVNPAKKGGDHATGAGKSTANTQVNERVEQLTGKVTTKKASQLGGGQTRNTKRVDATKLRSHSTMKSHHSEAPNPNSSLLNFTTGLHSAELGQRKSNNPQHSLILSAADSKGITSRCGANNGNQSAVVKPAHESKRTSIQGGSQKEWGLSDTEKALYGDRCPRGYEKLRLLGKGGAAVVWLARELTSGKQVALKQFPKPRNSSGQVQSAGVLDPTAKIEIEMGRLLFSDQSIYNGYSINPKEFPGILKIAKLHAVLEETKDVWLSYQVGGQCLTNLLFEVKGEFYKGERIYGVQHRDFYRALKADKQVLIDLIRMLAEVFDVLAMFRIVHADIKPDNILVDFDGNRLKDIKLIDFGSAFSYESPSHISATTPEYLAPEVLDYLERRAQNTDINGTNSTNLCRMQEPWSYDMWSMGAILLELLTGIPLWMSLKCRAVTQTGKQLFGMGIFGVQGRQGKKIMAKQNTSLKNLQGTLKKYDCYGLDKDPAFMDLLLKMLDPNPITRISPIEVLEHPYIKNRH